MILNYFERSCFLKDINHELFSQERPPQEKHLPNHFKDLNEIDDEEMSDDMDKIYNDILPEYLNWATSAAGITSAR